MTQGSPRVAARSDTSRLTLTKSKEFKCLAFGNAFNMLNFIHGSHSNQLCDTSRMRYLAQAAQIFINQDPNKTSNLTRQPRDEVAVETINFSLMVTYRPLNMFNFLRLFYTMIYSPQQPFLSIGTLSQFCLLF